MDKYRLDLKSEDDFEKIIVKICRNLLGVGTTGFAKGKDGGRDARFEGTAQIYPSLKNSWKGKFIVQAKHTINSEASCSDRNFFGNKSSTITLEIEKIIKLKKKDEINNYICFTNRKLTGNKELEIRKQILDETKIENVGMHGIEFIEDNITKEIIKEFNLNKSLLPFEFYEDDIREVIILFSNELDESTEREPITIEKLFHDERPDEGIYKKNTINDLSKEYFENEIRRNSQEYFKQIDDFLKDPINKKYSKQYRNTVRELNNLILIKREDFKKFEEIFLFIYQQIFQGDQEALKEHRNLIYVFLHFMYYQCDIGKN
jgi:hypothetical protein